MNFSVDADFKQYKFYILFISQLIRIIRVQTFIAESQKLFNLNCIVSSK